MTLRLTCPVCKHRMQYNLPDGIVYCPNCGYQPLHEWRRMAPETTRPRIQPLKRKTITMARLDIVECPNCGGDDLQPVGGQDAIRCPDCGTTYPIRDDAVPRPHTLRGVHLQRHGKSILWEIDQRLLNCPVCGAQVTISGDELTHVCPFCDSKQVLLADSQHTFEAPDAIIPFKIGAHDAREAVEACLKSGWHGLLRIFRDRIIRMSGKPLYLPWWAFQVKVDVYWRYRKFFGNNGIDRQIIDLDPVYAALTYHEELPQVWPYDLTDLRDYEPRYLAKIQAEIPQIKVEESAPEIIKQAIRSAERRTRSKKPLYVTAQTRQGHNVRDYLTLASHARQVNYRLLLLPVWVVQLYEFDDDTRRVFVNGQTGKVVLEGSVLWGVLRDSGRRSREEEGR